MKLKQVIMSSSANTILTTHAPCYKYALIPSCRQ